MGCRSLIGRKSDILKIWLQSGSIAVTHSPVQQVVIFNGIGGHLFLRDQGCMSSSNIINLRGHPCCEKCWRQANKPKLAQCFHDWACKICFVRLTHLTLQDDREEVLRLAKSMKVMFPELSEQCLENISYQEALHRAKEGFILFSCLPVCCAQGVFGPKSQVFDSQSHGDSVQGCQKED